MRPESLGGEHPDELVTQPANGDLLKFTSAETSYRSCWQSETLPRPVRPLSSNGLNTEASTNKSQLTNLLNLTPFTSPSIKKIDHVFEPPELMSGSGIPVTGIRPTTIPTFTNT